jgi:hypothetical protein
VSLLDKIKQEYDLCIAKPEEYKEKVDSISNLLCLTGKNRLMVDNCPVYIVGKYNISPYISFGINPGYSDINNPIEEREVRISWEKYQELYQNFFLFFERNGFKSPYYTSLWYLLTGLRSTFDGEQPQINHKWKFFQSCLTNMELIPYHSRGMIISSKLADSQLNYLVRRFKENINFIIKFKPKLFIFNGNPWHSLLIKNEIITEFEKVLITNKFSLYFFKIKDNPAVLFDKFFQRHFWGLTNEHRKITIPNLFLKKYPSVYPFN